VHASNSAQEAEAGKSPTHCHPGLHNKTLSQTNKLKKSSSQGKSISNRKLPGQTNSRQKRTEESVSELEDKSMIRWILISNGHNIFLNNGHSHGEI
jgi:hypothetical protein